ncbi:hypothetical protein [Trinickia mobilis]|uniref:hypothetical protein n=1 Tax=Trinickia mobilis TaxID=2816356 RepID=UPI001A8FA039|nr:hypothetical protein [Trinickia mobilis]
MQSTHYQLRNGVPLQGCRVDELSLYDAFASSPDIVCTVNGSGVLLQASLGAGDALGWSEEKRYKRSNSGTGAVRTRR